MKTNNIKILEYLIDNPNTEFDADMLASGCEIKRSDVASKMARELVKLDPQAINKEKDGRRVVFSLGDVNKAEDLLEKLENKSIKFYKTRTKKKEVKKDVVEYFHSLKRNNKHIIARKNGKYALVAEDTKKPITDFEYDLPDLMSRFEQIEKIGAILI